MKTNNIQELYKSLLNANAQIESINCTTKDCNIQSVFNIDDYLSDTSKDGQLSSFNGASTTDQYSSTFRNQPWVTPLVILSSFNVFIILCFEIFVIYKARRTIPSRRHLFLGQMLLFGLLICSLIGFAYVPNTSLTTCTVTRVGLGIGYSIVFGTLLVKTIFLLSLHSGTYLPASYQALLLFFIILTQVSIEIQWLIHRKPAIVFDDHLPTSLLTSSSSPSSPSSSSSSLPSSFSASSSSQSFPHQLLFHRNNNQRFGEERSISVAISGSSNSISSTFNNHNQNNHNYNHQVFNGRVRKPFGAILGPPSSSSEVESNLEDENQISGVCNHNLSSLLLSLLYDMLLIILVSCLSIKAKGHRENHKESLYISISIFGSTVIWITWIFGAMFASTADLSDAFAGFGITLNALLIFIVMFLPKTRQLAAMGKECASGGGYYCDHRQMDRDGHSSPSTSSPSLYTPSFLHLKPATFFPLVNKPTPPNNWSLFKQPFLCGSSPVGGGGTGGHQGGCTGGPGGTLGSLTVSPPPVKTISTSDRYFHQQPLSGPPGSRMWRNSYASYGGTTSIYHQSPVHQQSGHGNGHDETSRHEFCFYSPLFESSPTINGTGHRQHHYQHNQHRSTGQQHHHQYQHHSHLKGLRVPCY